LLIFTGLFTLRWTALSGQFKSVGSANPTIGNVGQLEYVEEDKVEVVVNDRGQHNEIRNVIKELKNVRVILAIRSSSLSFERLLERFLSND